MEAPSLAKVLSAPDDNLVQYILFPSPAVVAEPDESLEKFFEEVSAAAACLAKDYIWHKEEFNLIKIQDQVTKSWKFEGATGYGDNVEDEWFIVYILLELTKKFDDLVVR